MYSAKSHLPINSKVKAPNQRHITFESAKSSQIELQKEGNCDKKDLS